eukprot:6522346-Lingulodinium_polyedra.AAC.1
MSSPARPLYGMSFPMFRRKARSTAGVFTVSKRDESLRLMLDCRFANVLQKKPPSTDLATASAL